MCGTRTHIHWIHLQYHLSLIADAATVWFESFQIRNEQEPVACQQSNKSPTTLTLRSSQSLASDVTIGMPVGTVRMLLPLEVSIVSFEALISSGDDCDMMKTLRRFYRPVRWVKSNTSHSDWNASKIGRDTWRPLIFLLNGCSWCSESCQW